MGEAVHSKMSELGEGQFTPTTFLNPATRGILGRVIEDRCSVRKMSSKAGERNDAWSGPFCA
jgi:hypothetical protein